MKDMIVMIFLFSIGDRSKTDQKVPFNHNNHIILK